MKKKNNPARRACEKNNLAPILSEKNILARKKTPSPPPPWISNGPCLITGQNTWHNTGRYTWLNTGQNAWHCTEQNAWLNTQAQIQNFFQGGGGFRINLRPLISTSKKKKKKNSKGFLCQIWGFMWLFVCPPLLFFSNSLKTTGWGGV